ncbi:MAG: hypothetical protein JNK11_11055 [Alphaproteobacteria bacterium]|nr:hypothetical protein [Alphaproteobacteria bacterium]
MHHSPHINRLFVEDLVAAVRASPFALDVVRAMFPNPAAPEVQAGLEWRYPGRRGGGDDGMLVELRRPAWWWMRTFLSRQARRALPCRCR